MPEICGEGFFGLVVWVLTNCCDQQCSSNKQVRARETSSKLLLVTIKVCITSKVGSKWLKEFNYFTVLSNLVFLCVAIQTDLFIDCENVSYGSLTTNYLLFVQ